MMHIVLYEPEIPMNTGNIGRTCVLTNSRLHLIQPLGFSLSEAAIRRSGLDYWQHLNPSLYRDWEHFLEMNPEAKCYFASTKAQQLYTEVDYPEEAYFVFGRESAGLPESLLAAHPSNAIRIPMGSEFSRSFNLSVSAGVVLMEALRQHGFPGLH